MNTINNFTKTYNNLSQPISAKKINIRQENFKDSKDIFDVFSDKVINTKDANDMIEVPRSIFKGYLCFTAGSSLTLIGSVLKNKTISKTTTILGGLISILGTYNFVKPYIFKNDLTKIKK